MQATVSTFEAMRQQCAAADAKAKWLAAAAEGKRFDDDGRWWTAEEFARRRPDQDFHALPARVTRERRGDGQMCENRGIRGGGSRPRQAHGRLFP